MVNYLELIKENNLGKLLLSGNFGLEKENVRTTATGNLALTPHPAVFGDKARHPYVTTDFAESQVEMVTPTFATPKEALDFMEALHDLVSLELKDELLWPYSLPPILPDDESLIKEAQFSDPEITEYREYLADKYGKRKQLLSGVHFNVSFSDKFMQLLYKADPSNSSFREFNDQVYLKVARYYLKYSWLAIYLFGANSVAHESYIDCCRCDKARLTDDSYIFAGASSFRNGVSGYRNLEHFYVSYNSLYDYIEDIETAINQGHIIAAKEYYSQLRLKGHSKTNVLKDLHDDGICYIEIRTLDLNPLVKVGITLESLEFIHLLIIYALIAPDFIMSDDEYRIANQNQILAADANRDNGILLHYSASETRCLRQWGQEILENMLLLLREAGIPEDKLAIIENLRVQLQENQASAAQLIADGVSASGYANYFVSRARSYLELSQQTYYKFIGFEDLELSTQVLLKEAIKNGVKFKLLDRQDNFIELENRGHRQLVKQATRTATDNYVTILAMENKQVTKTILSRAGICVPRGEEYLTIESALVDYPLFSEKSIVVKPNSTNFGLGITIFKDKFSFEEYSRALEIAFSYDQRVLVEDFVPGKEYRFFVINGETVAVLNREPANIVGDGLLSIRDLVGLKNQNPLRGSGYKTPLELIKLEEAEAMFLAQQGLTFESVPKIGQKIYLRENSNISTGGDSLDYTDIVPKSYKRIAVKAAKSIGACICGVDMIIKNVNNPYVENNYALLELNYNPAIHIHTYPYLGQDRKLAEKLLRLLQLID
ncbi:MAG: bifunctional glutamate--cysteine ligase GshA/glutathione synthetase GshB [Neisseriales bacterium]|nr:MAG: bifunctional glutamate--cysteine ligase GshA/glutathione synthetase GshB [Neisseriales bacterium]